MAKVMDFCKISCKLVLIFVCILTLISESHSAKDQLAAARQRYYSANDFYPSYRKFVRNTQGQAEGRESYTPATITAPIQSPNPDVPVQEIEPKASAATTQTQTPPLSKQPSPPETSQQQPSQLQQSTQPQPKSVSQTQPQDDLDLNPPPRVPQSPQPPQPPSKSMSQTPNQGQPDIHPPPPLQLQSPQPPQPQPKSQPKGDLDFRNDQGLERDFIELTPWPPSLQLPLPLPKSSPLALATTESMQIPKMQSPVVPVQSSNCFMVFPGTPAWNDCFKRFNEEMSANKKSSPMKAVESQIRAPNTQLASTSNSVIAGYLIRAENIPLTTVVSNGVVKIMFSFGDDGDNEKLDLKRDGRLIIIKGLDGAGANAEVRIPEQVDPKDVKDSRTAYAVVITGPALKNNKNGDVHISQSQSGFGWSASGPQMHGVYPSGSGEFPPVLVPLKAFEDFSSKLKGILEGIQKQAFGVVDGPEQNQPKTSLQQQNNDPTVWHPWF